LSIDQLSRWKAKATYGTEGNQSDPTFRCRNSSARLDAPMATVRFTRNIQRHVPCPTREITGSTLRAVLDDYFRENEKARGYVLDEMGRIRQHMVVFIDGDLVHDRDGLSDSVNPDSIIDVIQALSGGSIQS
jgi:molybdopterin synthase sulfur carrier subunit